LESEFESLFDPIARPVRLNAKDLQLTIGTTRIMPSPDETLYSAPLTNVGNVALFLDQMQSSLEQLPNIRIWEGLQAIHFEQSEPNLYKLLLHDGTVIHTKHIIAATGPWHPTWLNQHVGKLVRTKKVVAMDILTPTHEHDQVYFFWPSGNFLIPDRLGDRWNFSITSEEYDCSPSSELKISEAEFAYARNFLRQRIPELAAQMIGGRVFCDSYAENRIPMVNAVDNMPGCAYICGASGAGFRLGPGLAYIALKQIGIMQ
jgi:glycine/D-amino acid oxidase-like deaminating enzyme